MQSKIGPIQMQMTSDNGKMISLQMQLMHENRE